MGLQKIKPHTVFRDNKLNHQIISGLKEKKVLITGATGGIGSSLVRMFANEGATIGIHFHKNHKQAKSLLHDIEIVGVKAKCFQADLLSTNELTLVQQFIEQFLSLIHI